MRFDAFIAVDWSGAGGKYNGIAVAICPPGRAAPNLVKSPEKRRSRQKIAEWLVDRLEKGQRLLIGFDFAFGFPFEERGYLGGHAREINNIFDLWALIESRSTGEADFGCRSFVDDPDFAHLFWKEMTATRSTNLSDHDTDALISAAGLRSIAGSPEFWTKPELNSDRVRREGWIFGI